MPDHSRRVYDSILELLSGEDNPTPLVRINKILAPTRATFYGKLEWYNPFGAVKDRIADNLVRDAEERGTLGEVTKLVEPTSGNTGLGLTMIANAKGYSLLSPLSTMIPLEKRAVLRFFGADLIELEDTLCPAPGAPEGAIAKAMETAEDPEFHMLNQYENEANPQSHYLTTGPEIWRQTEGKVTHFVAALGTCGTVTGTGRFLKEKNPNIKVIAVHPEEGHDIPGVRSIRQLKQTKLFRPEEYDQLVEVTNREAYDLCLRLNREESIIAGPSSGLALVGAQKVVGDDDGVVVVMFPDSIFKYASSVMRHFPEIYENAAGASESGPPMWVEDLIESSRNERDTIEIAEAARLREANETVFIDVRAKDEYAAMHVAGAMSVPTQDLTTAKNLPESRETPIVTVCNRGNLSIQGMLLLRSVGYTNVRSMNDGTIGWNDQGLPTENGS